MGSNRGRIGVLIAAVVAVAGLFVVLSGGDEDEPTPQSAASKQVEKTTISPGGEKDEKPDKPKPKPEIATIQVKGGQPVGGVRNLGFAKGGDIVFVVESDTADHVHFHGYDIFMDVAAGGEVKFDVPADVEGVFEVELEDTGVPIAEITVSPS